MKLAVTLTGICAPIWLLGSLALSGMEIARPRSPDYMLTRDEADFIWAASQNDFDTVANLIPKITDINIQNKRGSTALHWAAFNGNFDIANLLISYDAKVNIRDHERKTPLQWAAGRGFKNVTTLLLSHRADPDLTDEQGDTALHWATFNYHHNVIEKLILYRAEINGQNNAGITPLNSSLIAGNTITAKLLLEKNAELLSDKQRRTPIHCAVWGNSPEALGIILEHIPCEIRSALVNAADIEGETALHYCAQKGDTKSAALLMQYGANINAQCYFKQRTPLHICLRNHYGTVIHADNAYTYEQKRRNRLTTQQILDFIAVLKKDQKLETNTCDKQGFSIKDCIQRLNAKSSQEREQIRHAIFGTNNPITINSSDTKAL